MGRLSAYAKHRILKLRFKKNKRIIHIVDILKRDDNIKVSRQAVSTFLKKYLETKSIYDKPRTGRKRKLTQEEVQLIGQVTRLNRDITARAIKEYLNLNVSTYTILRATKLFEWNKINPNSNDSKKAAALERQMNGETPSKRRSRSSSEKRSSSQSAGKLKKVSLNNSDVGLSNITNSNETTNQQDSGTENQPQPSSTETTAATKQEQQNNQSFQISLTVNSPVPTTENVNEEPIVTEANSGDNSANASAILQQQLDNAECDASGGNEESESRLYDTNTSSGGAAATVKHKLSAGPEIQKINLNLIADKELQSLKNISCSPMSFATKILFKIFKVEELHGHNVSGKTLNRNLKAKLPLDSVRVGYIKYLVETYYNEKECKEMLANANSHKQDLWKSCHTAINKSILISERKAEAAANAVANGLNIDGVSAAVNGQQSDGGLSESIHQKTPNGALNRSSGNKKATNYKSRYNKVSPKQNGRKSTSGSGKKQHLRKRKFRQDSNTTSPSSSDDDDLYGTLHSEDISSDDDEARLDSDDSDAGAEEVAARASGRKRASEKTASNQKKPAQQQKISFRRSERQRKPAFKFNSSEFDTDSDEFEFSSDSSDNDFSEAELVGHHQRAQRNSRRCAAVASFGVDDDEDNADNAEDDEECPNEIELIQNIEKRLTSIKPAAAAVAESLSGAARYTKQTKKTNNKKQKRNNEQPEDLSLLSRNAAERGVESSANHNHHSNNASDSSEALAAANVAAAMKKQFVVVGAAEEEQSSPPAETDSTKSSIKETITKTPKADKAAQPSSRPVRLSTRKSDHATTTTQRSPAASKNVSKSTTATSPNAAAPSSSSRRSIKVEPVVERRLTRSSVGRVP